MKTLQSLQDMTTGKRIAFLRSELAAFGNHKKTLAKALFAAEIEGDFEPGEKMNAFATRVMGCELRRECQGVYQFANVLRAMKSGKVVLTEEQFDTVRDFALETLSGLLSSQPEKVARAVEIALSGDKNVVEQLKDLKKKAAKTPAGKSASDSAPLVDNEIFPDLSDLNVTTYQVPDSLVILNHPEILKRIVSEVETAATAEDCDAFLGMFQKLAARAEKRKESLESARAESAKPAKRAKASQLELVA